MPTVYNIASRFTIAFAAEVNEEAEFLDIRKGMYTRIQGLEMMDCKQDQMVWTGPRPRGVLEGQEGHLGSPTTSKGTSKGP